MLADQQIVLADAVTNYIDVLGRIEPIYADPTHYGIRHTYFLLRTQAAKDGDSKNLP